jgi:hypothetical protein
MEMYAHKRYRYDEIRSLYVEQLAFTWMKDSASGATRTSLDEKIDSFVRGNLTHAAAAVAEFWEIANKDGEIKAPVVSSLRFFLLLLYVLCRDARTQPGYVKEQGKMEQKSQPMGSCEDGAHRLSPRRHLFRQSVLG